MQKRNPFDAVFISGRGRRHERKRLGLARIGTHEHNAGLFLRVPRTLVRGGRRFLLAHAPWFTGRPRQCLLVLRRSQSVDQTGDFVPALVQLEFTFLTLQSFVLQLRLELFDFPTKTRRFVVMDDDDDEDSLLRILLECVALLIVFELSAELPEVLLRDLELPVQFVELQLSSAAFFVFGRRSSMAGIALRTLVTRLRFVHAAATAEQFQTAQMTKASCDILWRLATLRGQIHRCVHFHEPSKYFQMALAGRFMR